MWNGISVCARGPASYVRKARVTIREGLKVLAVTKTIMRSGGELLQ